MYIETGLLPVRFILQGRRLMYYWTLLNKKENELVKRVFEIQKKFNTTDDWVLQIEQDKIELNIDISEESIKQMKKKKIKKYLKEKLNEKAVKFLLDKKERHTKTENLNIYGLQKYLQTNELSTKQKKLLFSLRTRSIDVKTNYKNKYKFNMECRMCSLDTEEESEKHLMKCSEVLKKINNEFNLIDANYLDIFSEDLSNQINITRIFEKIIKIKTLHTKSNQI